MSAGAFANRLMDNPQIFKKAASLLEAGENIALATVIAATGSTPGKVGYKMLVWAGGRETIGTVGGGLVEAEAIKAAGDMLDESAVQVLQFQLGRTPEDERGICGGIVEILLESFDESSLRLFRRISDNVRSDQGAVLVSVISSEGPPGKILLTGGRPTDSNVKARFPAEISQAVEQAATGPADAGKVCSRDMEVFIERVEIWPTVVILGAGHLAAHICRYAKSVQFRVTVCDDRSEYANAERFPDADEIIVEDFARVLDKIEVGRDSYVVIVTRGHKSDEVVLEQAVRSNARYIGMIGSRRKVRLILQKLARKGVSEGLLNRVYSPIGISIGALTPEEIGLSIVCELVKIRRLGPGAEVGHMKESARRRCSEAKLMINAVVLAAGESKRMGRPKPLLPFEQTTFLGQILSVLGASDVAATTVVLGAEADAIQDSVDLSGVRVVVNEAYEKGQLSSLVAAMNAMPVETEAIILCLVDHPFVTAELVNRIVGKFAETGSPIIVPVYEGRRGHPTLFARGLFAQLLGAPEDQGARYVLYSNESEVLELETSEAGILIGIDTPDDYVRHFGRAP